MTVKSRIPVSRSSRTLTTSSGRFVGRAASLARPAVRELAPVLVGTAALALLGQVALPLPFTPVPVTLGTFAALGVGSVLGPRRGMASALLLAVLAAAGVPVLAGWSAGVTASFGYVLGYTLAAGVAGRGARGWLRPAGTAAGSTTSLARRVLVLGATMLLASAVVYVPGLLWLRLATGASWAATVGMGLVPFVVGDLLKSLAVAGLVPVRSIWR
ncbi:biotin transporter BioY [Actinomyces wuliandei]|uniref:biotin transporter BioY n=1 Tax=Actinomyces wuliandei TaxID=2057743 RepID=UPI000FDA008E|nr:biotin transporter BioY [Actinomyces wuliandei]